MMPHDHTTASPEHAEHGRMFDRGVTRGAPETHGHGDDEHGGHSMHGMSRQDRIHGMHAHHHRTMWIWWSIILLGLWMIALPLSIDYARGGAIPSGGRSVWLSMSARAAGMFYSDIISGIALVVLGWRLLTPGRVVSQWLACFVGVWITMAPLVFWSPSAAAYLNDTFVGALVIALAILIPGMPGMIMMMKRGPQIPPGWTYNPSSWPQRSILIALAFVGWLVSRYLATYQLGYQLSVAEPFFGAGTLNVLNSRMSHSLPISDAGLGALAYTFEFLMGWMGSPARWRTMPWMVLFFGILIVPLGLTHIVLVISQPVVVGAWCTLCLLAAAIMLPMIPLMLDEVVAMCQFMRKAVWRDGNPFWRTFWKGGTLEMQENGRGGDDDRSPELAELPGRPGSLLAASVWGMNIPWNLAAASLLGIWLMFAPALFHTGGAIADSDHLTAALILTLAVIAMAEVVRAGRAINVLAGAWLLIAPWILAGGTTGSTVSDIVCGIGVIVLSIPRGAVREHYGSWDACIV